jgi:multidrug transporter EmrE-like cation transporter
LNGLGYVLLSVLFNVGGQLVLKAAMRNLGEYGVSFGHQFLKKTLHVLLYPLTVAGLLLYGISAIFWLAALSKMELSKAYPMISLGYIAIFFLSAVLFGESLSMVRFLGILLVGLGLLLVALS